MINMKSIETIICGGNEIIKSNIPFSPPDISEYEIDEVVKALRSGWITTGPRERRN